MTFMCCAEIFLLMDVEVLTAAAHPIFDGMVVSLHNPAQKYYGSKFSI